MNLTAALKSVSVSCGDFEAVCASEHFPPDISYDEPETSDETYDDSRYGSDYDGYDDLDMFYSFGDPYPLSSDDFAYHDGEFYYIGWHDSLDEDASVECAPKQAWLSFEQAKLDNQLAMLDDNSEYERNLAEKAKRANRRRNTKKAKRRRRGLVRDLNPRYQPFFNRQDWQLDDLSIQDRVRGTRNRENVKERRRDETQWQIQAAAHDMFT